MGDCKDTIVGGRLNCRRDAAWDPARVAYAAERSISCSAGNRNRFDRPYSQPAWERRHLACRTVHNIKVKDKPCSYGRHAGRMPALPGGRNDDELEGRNARDN